VEIQHFLALFKCSFVFQGNKEVLMDDMSFQLSFECCQGFCILDEGGQIIPPVPWIRMVWRV